MSIWLTEIKDLTRLYKSIDGSLPELEKELEKLIVSEDENMLLVYARRCLEVRITQLHYPDMPYMNAGTGMALLNTI